MKKTNKLISILLSIAMLLTMAPLSAFTASAAHDTDGTVYLNGDIDTNTTENFYACVTDANGEEIGRYNTFSKAVTAAEDNEGSTLVLLDDITLTEKQNIESGKFILDLNGKTLTGESVMVICVNSDADLTIKDSGTGGAVKATGDNAEAVRNFGTLTVESGYFYAANKASALTPIIK